MLINLGIGSTLFIEEIEIVFKWLLNGQVFFKSYSIFCADIHICFSCLIKKKNTWVKISDTPQNPKFVPIFQN